MRIYLKIFVWHWQIDVISLIEFRVVTYIRCICRFITVTVISLCIIMWRLLSQIWIGPFLPEILCSVLLPVFLYFTSFQSACRYIFGHSIYFFSVDNYSPILYCTGHELVVYLLSRNWSIKLAKRYFHGHTLHSPVSYIGAVGLFLIRKLVNLTIHTTKSN